FASLADDALAVVAHSLALVWFGFARRADLGGELPHLLLVDPGDFDALVHGHHDVQPFRHFKIDRMAEAELQHERTPVEFALPTHTYDVEVLLVALGHALDHVPDQGPRSAMQ